MESRASSHRLKNCLIKDSKDFMQLLDIKRKKCREFHSHCFQPGHKIKSTENMTLFKL